MDTKPSFGQKAADYLVQVIGSWFAFWGFTWFLAGYISTNTIPDPYHFDPYPFGFLTLVLSLLANYQTLFVMIAQAGQARATKRQEERDRQSQEQILKLQGHVLDAVQLLLDVQSTQGHVLEAVHLLLEEERQHLIDVSETNEEIQQDVETILSIIEQQQDIKDESANIQP